MNERERWRRVSEILDRVLDAAPEERAAIVEASCAGDEELRGEVEELLRSADRDGSLSLPVLEVGGALLVEPAEGGPAAACPDDVVGTYRLVSELGRGGMGEVWLGERIGADFEQRVAVKLLRPGLDSGLLDERFRRERRILAALDHPHIARLLDGGVTGDGRPYIVMEAVEGEPITAHCRRRAAPLEERLRLFLEVCDAVATAHRRLVVHRDLKPSNVLVSAAGGVKLLDFGVAKLLANTEEEPAPALTALDERWLTPAYAAPEQIAGEPVSTATDVFALGVVLYELLAGALPFAGATKRELERAILESAPSRPSARATETAATSEGAALEPRRLRGDLDAIVLTALRKEPDRRYASVDALAADVRRFLDGQPVAARPDSFSYRTGKFARRHRWALAGGAAAVLALVVGLVLALAAQKREALAARRAIAVRDFLVRLFEQASPEVNGGDEPTLKQVVATGTAEVESELGGQPELAADLLATLAKLHFELDDFAGGLALAKRARKAALAAHGPDSPEAVEALALVGEGLHLTEANDQAMVALAEAETHARAGSGADSVELAKVVERKATVLRRLGRFDEAEKAAEDVAGIYERRLGRNSLEHVGARSALAEILFQRQGDGDSARAVEIQRDVVARRRQLLRPGHPAIGRALNDLAAYVGQVGDYAESERLFRQAIEIHTKVSGADGVSALNSRVELAPILSELGRYDEALAELEAVAAAWKRRSGPTSWAYCNAVNKIGFTLYQRGRATEAVPWFGEALAVFRSRLGAEHPDTLSVWNNYGGAMAENGDLTGAERELVQVVAIKRKTGYKVATSLNLLGRTLRRKGDAAGALALHRESFAIVSGEVGADSVDAVIGRYLAGLALLELARFDDAAAEIAAALTVDRAKRPAGHTRIGEDLTALARARLGQGRPDEAERLAREGVAVQVSAVGPDNGKTGEAHLVLGEALLAAGRPADARLEIAAAQPILEGAGPAYRAQLERARRLTR